MNFKTIEYADFDAEKVEIYSKKLPTIFRYNDDIDKTAYLNWRAGRNSGAGRQFVVLGEAYFSTAYNLIQQCLENNDDHKADSWIFPILFNTVHGIEIYLKAINSALRVLLKKVGKITDGGHDIKLLSASAKNLIEKYINEDKSDTSTKILSAINLVEKFVLNICEKTGDMSFARYPLKKNLDGQFYIQTFENEVIDLELINEQIGYVYNMLDFIYNTLNNKLDIQEDMMSDY